ncbi:hypothetical protein SEVIR_5G331450v4 [Setaria viridis]
MQGMVDDIRLEVRKLSKHWERVVLNRPPPLLETTPSAAERPSATSEANRPNGHRDDKFHREDGYGSVTTIVQPPSRVRYAPPHPHTHLNCPFLLCLVRIIVGNLLVMGNPGDLGQDVCLNEISLNLKARIPSFG